MRSAWWLIVPLCVGCSGRNVVAGKETTRREQLAESLPSWCEQFCGKMGSCGEGKEVDVSDCASECQEVLRRYTLGGEACATVGEQFQVCLDALSCSELFAGDANHCEPSSAAHSVCPDDGDVPNEPLPMSGSAGAVAAGGAPSTGGSTTTPVGGTLNYGIAGGGGVVAIGGSSPVGGSAQGGMQGTFGGTSPGGAAGSGPVPPVQCEDNVTAEDPDEGGLACEGTLRQCSDGHQYGWLCAGGTNQPLACSCFVDEQFTAGFITPTSACPTLESVNEGCGLSLAL
ncbi:MAG: hypothetical protein K0R38_3032 [Polyangiaceae bacterium]|nr:hypothetical protein [Polyangiaceae bacterium]